LLFFGDPTPGGEPIVRHLARLGWDESRGTVAYEARFARGRRESYPALAAELSALPLDAQFTVGTDLLRALQPSASKVPVVFIVSDDPVATGLVASLAGRPGGRFTGVSFMSPQLAGKRLELLREIVPSLGRVAALTDAGHLGLYVPELERAAQALGVTVVPIAFEAPEEFPAAFARARASGAQAMFVVPSRYTLAYAQRIASLAVEHRIAAISAYDSFARSGGLMAYGPTAEESTERAAAMLDRVLRGAKPADMPVEQASRIELIVNKDAVAAMKLTLLPSLQARVQRWVP
jgi:putative ABC transport system substrate-binding protein